MSTATPSAPTTDVLELHGDELPDGRRPHHHARMPVTRGEDGTVTMLCGWTGTPVEDAAQRPCCPGCAEVIGGPCGA